MKLLTIPISHYCEKARWALAWHKVPYQEERHLQGLHYPYSYWLSGGPNVPVLVDGKKVISDSTAILKHLECYAAKETRLYPEDDVLRQQVEEMEDRFDEQLGIESRRWIYYHYLQYPNAMLKFASQGIPPIERALGPICFPLLKAFVRTLLQINDAKVEVGLRLSRQIVQEVDALLGDGRKYLVGERFSAADLSLACMMAPFVLPRQYGVSLPALKDVPVSMQSTVKEFQNTLTGRFVLRLFETER
jgi:glutathione S-transferase